jgi:hypothetical protein
VIEEHPIIATAETEAGQRRLELFHSPVRLAR